MTTAYEIPATPSVPQTFAIALSGVTYVMTLTWNTVVYCWVVDLADSTGTAILQGVPVVTGADLLEQVAYLQLGGNLVAQTENDVDAVPTFDNFGINGHLFYLVP